MVNAGAMEWSIMVLSLFATILNIRKQRLCFAIWVLTNAAWCAIDAFYGIYAQSLLHMVYFFLAIWGVFEWSKTTPSS